MSCTTTSSGVSRGGVITVIQNDDNPPIRIQFIDRQSNIPLDISHPDWTPKVRFRKRNEATTLFDAIMTKIDQGRDGWALLLWPDDSLDDLATGNYELQPYLDVDGSVQTVTNLIRVKVAEKFAAVAGGVPV